jgi:hypothetical protein
MMLQLIFTTDYEIHGNGDGSPLELMVETTERQLKLMNRYGARLTIFADVAEIIKFKEYRVKTGSDDYHYEAITQQLKNAVKTGHDVQLHIHSSYFNAVHENGRWKQNWREYNLANLPYEKIAAYVRTGKNFLEELLQPVNKDYECIAFRAAGWSMVPARNIVNALVNNGIRIDSSVWKYGRRKGMLDFDYCHAHSEAVPWFADEKDICRKNNEGKILEVPIYCVNKHAAHFVTPIRLYRIVNASFHKHKVIEESETMDGVQYKRDERSPLDKLKSLLTQKQPWKLDLNQATSGQMIRSLKQIERKYGSGYTRLPVVFTGHSKIFVKYNLRTLEPVLKYAARRKDKYSFATFRDVEVNEFR